MNAPQNLYGQDRLTREELYARVWESPMRTVARQLGLSDVALAKHCRKMKIPVPGRGYWARRAAGQRIRKPALPALPPTDSVTPRVTHFQQQSMSSAAALPPVPEALAAQIAFEALPENRIRVADTLRGAHELVRITADALESRGTSAGEPLGNRQLPQLDLDVSQAALHRALRIMDALLKALEKRGWRISRGSHDDRKTYVTILDQRIPFGIREPLKKVENEPAKPVRLRTGEVYTPYQSRYRDEASGRLALVIRNSWGHGVHRSWDERSGGPLEERLNQFALALATEAFGQLERQRRREEEERRRVEVAQARLAEQRRRELEVARGRALQDQVARWRASRDMSEYLAAVRERAERSGALEQDGALAEWLCWAEGYARPADQRLVGATRAADCS